MKEHKKMTDDLMKIFEVSHENPDLFTSFDIPKCAKNAREKFETNLEIGTIKTKSFRDYFKEELLLLTDVPQVKKNSLVNYFK